MSKKMTSVKIPKTLHQQLLESIVKSGYGLRGKSKWLIEAIEVFLSMSNYDELVDIATEDSGVLDDVVCVRLPDNIDLDIERAITVVRKRYPSLEGVRSNIIRASIMQKLLGAGA